MKLRRLGFIFFGLVAVLAAAAGVAFWGVTRTPEFYRTELARPQDPVVRREQAKAFESRAVKLAETVRRADAWQHEFDQDQINAWLAVELGPRFGDVLPAGVQNPRVQLRDGSVEVGFQVEDPGTRVKTVVSLKLRPALVKPNRLEVTVESIRAGIVPVPVERILDDAIARLNQSSWKVERRRRGADEVLTFELNRALPEGATLESLAVLPGKVKVEGHGAEQADANAVPPQNQSYDVPGGLESSSADELSEPEGSTSESPAGDDASQNARH